MIVSNTENKPILYTDLFINGQFVKSKGEKPFDVINPATEELIVNIQLCNEEDVQLAVKAAQDAFESWSSKTPGERALYLLRIADVVENNKEKLAQIEADNVGKPWSLAIEDVETFIDNIRFFAGAARSLTTINNGQYVEGFTSVLMKEPLGVVAAIAPWNYPLMMAGWKFGPAIVMGNTMVLKPSEFTPLSTLYLMSLIQDILPPGVLNVVTGEGRLVADVLLNSEEVKMISLTGSVRSGQYLVEHSASKLKKIHLELGGKAPVVIFDDADIQQAIDGILMASFCNTGQECAAATRIYVDSKIYDEFSNQLTESVSAIKVGAPFEEATEMGPLFSAQHLDRVSGFVERAKVNKDIKILTGGHRIEQKGYYYAPTVITGMQNDHELIQEEIFGPVITVMPFDSEEEAYTLANDSKYALAASVWTKDVSKSFRATKRIKAGTVWVNTHLIFASEFPHSGGNMSGHGKDQSIYALEEYTQVKHVMFKQ